uniref:Uncharacterized protein n=1 Tax=Aegilops tauschii subsp. strangulata TaxID=200361 RepID=A0A453CYU2_AEGTS
MASAVLLRRGRRSDALGGGLARRAASCTLLDLAVGPGGQSGRGAAGTRHAQATRRPGARCHPPAAAKAQLLLATLKTGGALALHWPRLGHLQGTPSISAQQHNSVLGARGRHHGCLLGPDQGPAAATRHRVHQAGVARVDGQCREGEAVLEHAVGGKAEEKHRLVHCCTASAMAGS